MLALKLGLSLGSPRPMGAWEPSDETSLEAWYQNKVGVVLNGSDVSEWRDSSPNNRHMVQATASEQPAYNDATGTLTFDSSNTENLQTTSQISLSGQFVVGFYAQPSLFNNVIIADNTTSNEFFKYSNIDFSKVIENSVETLRLSVDESLTVLKYEGRKPSFLNGLQKYTHSEILAK
jgi:hypothetical protein